MAMTRSLIAAALLASCLASQPALAQSGGGGGGGGGGGSGGSSSGSAGGAASGTTGTTGTDSAGTGSGVTTGTAGATGGATSTTTPPASSPELGATGEGPAGEASPDESVAEDRLSDEVTPPGGDVTRDRLGDRVAPPSGGGGEVAGTDEDEDAASVPDARQRAGSRPPLRVEQGMAPEEEMEKKTPVTGGPDGSVSPLGRPLDLPGER